MTRAELYTLAVCLMLAVLVGVCVRVWVGGRSSSVDRHDRYTELQRCLEHATDADVAGCLAAYTAHRP